MKIDNKEILANFTKAITNSWNKLSKEIVLFAQSTVRFFKTPKRNSKINRKKLPIYQTNIPLVHNEENLLEVNS